MGNKLYAKIVIAVGMLIMWYSQHMDVTYGGVVNIHKLSQQSQLMMFGGFVFLGGIILFAVARMKQTKEDEAKEEGEINNRSEEILRKGKNIADTATSAVDLAWNKSKKPLKYILILFGALVLILFINIAISITIAINKQAEAEKAKAIQEKEEAALASKEKDKRVLYIKDAAEFGRIFGFKLGEDNRDTLLAKVKNAQYKDGRIECIESLCQPILSGTPFFGVIGSIQFTYCANESGDLLTKVEMFYRSERDASSDYEYFRSNSLAVKPISSEISRHITSMPYVISITQKRGEWDACGSK